MAINAMRDPLQGYDIKVTVIPIAAAGTPGTLAAQLAGGFNSFMWRVVNQTDAYITLNSRIPRMLDGEVITVWSLDQGLVNLSVVANTFGGAFATAYAQGRTAIIPRSQRFNLYAEAGMGTTVESSTPITEAGFSDGSGVTPPLLAITIGMARVDTLTFGVAPGKHPAANSWQGTGESINDSTDGSNQLPA